MHWPSAVLQAAPELLPKMEVQSASVVHAKVTPPRLLVEHSAPPLMAPVFELSWQLVALPLVPYVKLPLLCDLASVGTNAATNKSRQNFLMPLSSPCSSFITSRTERLGGPIVGARIVGD